MQATSILPGILDAEKYNTWRNSARLLPVGVLYVQVVTRFPPYVSGNLAGNTARNVTIRRYVGHFDNP